MLHQFLEIRLGPGRQEQVDVVVQDTPVAEHDVVASLGGQLIGDLGMEDPGLGGQIGLLIDRQRASTSHLPNHFEMDVAGLETGGQTVAEGSLTHPVATDEGQFETLLSRHRPVHSSRRSARPDVLTPAVRGCEGSSRRRDRRR